MSAEKAFQPVIQPLPGEPCVFCEIIAGRSSRKVRYENEEFLVIHNALAWVPVMFLIVPKKHVSQEEFWQSEKFPRAANLAVDIAKKDSPEGYRLLSNFGAHGMQSQSHGHLHILGGENLGLYLWGRWPGGKAASEYQELK